jgi:hypothetical protein
LKEFKNSEPKNETYNKDELKKHFNVNCKNPVMMYALEYCGVTVFRRYFENTVKSKEKIFYKKLKKYVSKYIIPSFKKTFVDVSSMH